MPILYYSFLSSSITLFKNISLIHPLHPQATDIAEQRGQRVVGPEDILFVMRRDPLKLQRLVHYMGELLNWEWGLGCLRFVFGETLLIYLLL